MLEHVKDEIIIEAYHKSIELDLDKDFILILKNELIKRGIFVD